MKAEKPSVLIVCYSFPPIPGIGGRRWAKFAKYFARNGVQCHVVNAYNYTINASLWNKDVQSPAIIIHPLKFRLQYWLGLYSSKTSYRILSKIIRIAINLTQYSPYFSSSLSRKLLHKKCIELIEKYNITTVIASGDPYMQYYITALKKYCDIRVILDYRDTWNDRPKYYLNKFHKLTKKQRAFFEFCENESLKNCDEVVCVYEPMTALLSARSEKSKEHFHIIANGFDKNDYPKISAAPLNTPILTLYFGGNISPGDLANYFVQFLKCYSNLRYSARYLWEQFRIEINGDCPPYFEKELKSLNDPNIRFEKGFLSGKKYMEKLNNSHFGILSIPDEYIDCPFITKTYDYLYLEKPIVYLGKEGKVSEFIEKKNIGFVFNPTKDAQAFFQRLLNLPPHWKYPKEMHKKIEEEYDINNLSLKYLHLLGLNKKSL